MFRMEEVDRILEAIKCQPSESFESEKIEFKCYRDGSAFFNKSQDIAAELSAFANLGGGTLIVGVKDSSDVRNCEWETQLVGFEELDCLEVERRLKGNLRPSVSLQVVNHNFEEINFLLIRIARYGSGLVMTAGGKCYIRSGRDSNPMTPEEVMFKVKSSNGFDWSKEVIEGVSPEQALDEQQIEEAMAEFGVANSWGDIPIPLEHFLEKIGVTINGGVTRGGLLFLGKTECIRDLIGNIEYRFSKLDKGGRLSVNEVWSGSLWESISRSKYLLGQLLEYSEFVCNEKSYRFPNICETSFEEALVNSLVHRDYAIDGLTIVEVNESTINFTNPGSFFGGITPENIFTHPPRYRNPHLASILMHFDLVDRAGMGTRRMNIDSLRLGRREAVFVSENNHVKTSLEVGSIKEGVFVTTSPYEEYDVSELVMINILYGSGYEEVSVLLEKIGAFVSDPVSQIFASLKRVSCLSFVGNKDGIFVEVDDVHREKLKAYKKVRVYQTSDNYVSIFDYLIKNGIASSAELSRALEISPIAKVQRLLRDASFIEKAQDRTETTWRLRGI